MKSLVLFFVMLCAFVFSAGFSSASKTMNSGQKERAITQFNTPVMIQGVVLKGRYLFVHDDAAMKRGESCTSIYKGDAELPEDLVISFNCVPMDRSKVSHFTVRTVETSAGTELREFQFRGETEAHLVPLK